MLQEAVVGGKCVVSGNLHGARLATPMAERRATLIGQRHFACNGNAEVLARKRVTQKAVANASGYHCNRRIAAINASNL